MEDVPIASRDVHGRVERPQQCYLVTTPAQLPSQGSVVPAGPTCGAVARRSSRASASRTGWTLDLIRISGQVD
jgi:hypothetical protein